MSPARAATNRRSQLAPGGQDSYHAAFVDLGVEDTADFKDVTDDDLDAIGLKKIEKNRFRKALIYAE